ncbi:hypothetical protein H5410_041323 [Solanum commersonii]|uniref:Uncharacterized protein n=1 Tax=Solanum commersonii TaxID=4109 RepID=A0A9J5XRH8_SOLCO|nr:hypothetical protein H5410_041323 [Solanum commersonii]
MNLTRVRQISVPVIQAFACEKYSEAMRRRRVLRKFDKELANRNYKAANSLLKQLQHMPRALLGFGSVKLVILFFQNLPLQALCWSNSYADSFTVMEVPKIIPAINTQQLSMVDSSSFESLVDTIMCSIKYSIKFAISDEEVLLSGMEDAMGSETDNSPCEDHQMCLQHEVGHFLVGYLVGVLPRSYEVPSLQDITQDKFAQGNVQFLGFEFLKEVDINTISSKRCTQGKLKSKVLNRIRRRNWKQLYKEIIAALWGSIVYYVWQARNWKLYRGTTVTTNITITQIKLHFSVRLDMVRKTRKGQRCGSLIQQFFIFLCVILGGLAAEHLVFGYSELLHSDVQKLDRVLRWLCYNENEADSLVRWAILTTLSLLSHHHEARSRLAEAMTSRRSIGYCIDMIENTL